jgi:ACS family tartrate transporter-like MFS transporter
VNISFAALTMNADLGLTATLYGWGAGIFFFGYLLFQVPSNLLLERFGARRWIAALMLAWGAVSVATGAINSPAAFLAARFLLGLAESGFFPGVILYLTYWVTPGHRGRIIAGFMFAIPMSNVIGGPLSSLILSSVHGPIAPWRWLLILEGAPALLGALAVLTLLPNGPRDAKWLTEAEKRGLAEALTPTGDKVPSRRVWAVMLAPEVLLFCAVYFGLTQCGYGLSLWLPQMIKAAGVGAASSALITAVPYAFAAAGMMAWARFVDSRGVGRASSVWMPACAAAVGLVASAFAAWPLQLALFALAAVGSNSAVSSFWTLPTHRFRPAETAVAVGMINSTGNLGGFVGPVMIGWIKDATHSFQIGLLFVATLVTMSALLLLRVRRPA